MKKLSPEKLFRCTKYLTVVWLSAKVNLTGLRFFYDEGKKSYFMPCFGKPRLSKYAHILDTRGFPLTS